MAPKITELMMCMEEHYGHEAVETLNDIVRKAGNGT